MRAALATLALATGLAAPATAAVVGPLPDTISGTLYEGPSGSAESMSIGNIRLSRKEIGNPDSGWAVELFFPIGFPYAAMFNGFASVVGLEGGSFRVSGETEGSFGHILDFLETRSLEPVEAAIDLMEDGTWACYGACTFQVPNEIIFPIFPLMFGESSGEPTEPSTYEVTLTGGTYELPAAIPLPATAPLLALGLAGIAALRRRKA